MKLELVGLRLPLDSLPWVKPEDAEPIVELDPWVRTTDAVSPTTTSRSVVSGPMTQRPPMRVPPSSCVPGWMTVSRPMLTSMSIQVVAGSTTVTPAS